MAGTISPSVLISTRPSLKRSQTSQPRVAACNLWSSGQFSPWSIQHPRPGSAQQRTSTISAKVVASPAISRPGLSSKSASTTDLAKMKSTTAVTPSRTTAPLFPDEILDNLYISDLDTARAVLSPNYAAPGRPQIRYVLSVLDKDKDRPQIVESDGGLRITQKFIKINDWMDANLVQHLPEARDFIRQSLANKDGGVLVHCRKGVSRSGSVIVAYVMETLGLDVDDATKYVAQRRPQVVPNAGFKQQLVLWQQMNFALQDDQGVDKERYRIWRDQSHFRVC